MRQDRGDGQDIETQNETPHPQWPYPVSMRKQTSDFNRNDIDQVLEFGKADILLLLEVLRFQRFRVGPS
jgi:hypothetical protein